MVTLVPVDQEPHSKTRRQSFFGATMPPSVVLRALYPKKDAQ